jgi:flagellar biosynthesis GTPase FlhF
MLNIIVRKRIHVLAVILVLLVFMTAATAFGATEFVKAHKGGEIDIDKGIKFVIPAKSMEEDAVISVDMKKDGDSFSIYFDFGPGGTGFYGNYVDLKKLTKEAEKLASKMEKEAEKKAKDPEKYAEKQEKYEEKLEKLQKTEAERIAEKLERLARKLDKELAKETEKLTQELERELAKDPEKYAEKLAKEAERLAGYAEKREQKLEGERWKNCLNAQLHISWDVLANMNVADFAMVGDDGEEVECRISGKKAIWYIKHFSLYYFRRR